MKIKKSKIHIALIVGVVGVLAVCTDSLFAQDAANEVAASGGAITGWTEKILSGGFTVFAQIGLSIIGASFMLERFAKLKRDAIAPPHLVEKAKKLWAEGKMDELKALDQKDDSTLAKIISNMATYRNQSPADISMAAGDIAGRELEIHSQKLYPIAVVASVEPLLGLLGTVLGMIEAFDTVAVAGALGDPAQLAGGISMALLTTAIGLSIAVPFLLVYHVFKSRLSIFTIELEREVTGLINLWFNTDPDQKDESKKKTRG